MKKTPNAIQAWVAWTTNLQPTDFKFLFFDKGSRTFIYETNDMKKILVAPTFLYYDKIQTDGRGYRTRFFKDFASAYIGGDEEVPMTNYRRAGLNRRKDWRK
jgi:hypothetical protein